MNAGKRFGSALAGSIVAVALIAPTSGSAVTIGSDLKPGPDPNTGFGCGAFNNCAVLQTGIPGNPHSMTAPFGGVIDRWRYRKGEDDQRYEVRLLVARMTDGGDWKFVARSHRETIRKPPGIYEFDANVPIRKGQYIAMRLEGDVDEISVDKTGATHVEWFPTPPLDTLTTPDYDNDGVEFLWNARVRDD